MKISPIILDIQIAKEDQEKIEVCEYLRFNNESIFVKKDYASKLFANSVEKNEKERLENGIDYIKKSQFTTSINDTPALLIGDIAELLKIITGKEISQKELII